MTQPLRFYWPGAPREPSIQVLEPAEYTLPSGLTATEEQCAIIEAALTRDDNLVINALAGAAKTSTLELLCKYLPSQPILCLAFNKRIADEMTKRLPSNVTCKTFNALGHRIWGTATGRRLNLQADKMYEIFSEKVKALGREQQKEIYEVFSETLKCAKAAKRLGYIPEGAYVHAKRICEPDAFLATCEALLDEPLTGLQRSLIDATLVASIGAAYNGTIDFDDQLYLPTLFGGSFPKFPLVMVDEAQDLSEINHAMLRKLATGRLIAVGDPWQSIYAFRGAKQSGMQSLASEYNAVQLPLSVSFRCPEEIVKFVRWRVPHMQWRKEGGHVETLNYLHAHSIPDGAAFICRNNAPLFRLALLLLRAGRGVHLVGTDLGPSLVKTLKKLGEETLTQEQTLDAIAEWERERKAKTKAKAAVADKAECLRVFASFGKTLGEAIIYCEHLFKQRGAIQLLTGHKAKGLEWETVFHLNPSLVPSIWATEKEELEQEHNLAYVIATRAKETLYEIDLANIMVDQ